MADVHISPHTVMFLNGMGHDVVRVNSVMAPTALDSEILVKAIEEGRVVLTQDLGFSSLIASENLRAPSLITLRLRDKRVSNVNRRLDDVLPALENAVTMGVMATVTDSRVRVRHLPPRLSPTPNGFVSR